MNAIPNYVLGQLDEDEFDQDPRSQRDFALKPPAAWPDHRLSHRAPQEGRHPVVAASPAMRKVLDQVRQIANLDIPVLLLGESGTGKEVVARLIHNTSCRSHRTFMRVNCAAMPSDLLESELFGHEAGAFTGATRAKPGKFEICQKGTILLDEIGEMPFTPQAKFLHILQDGEFARLGSPFPRRVDVRILAATNINIQEAIAARRFREDLYYRISAFSIYIPPLRARREDIPPLLDQLMHVWAARLGRPTLPISRALLEACLQHSWPGNVRELENFVARYVICGNEDQVIAQLRASDGGVGSPRMEPNPDGTPPGDLKSQIRMLKKQAERDAIVRALELTKGSRKEAARMLNISVRALQYKMLECEIN